MTVERCELARSGGTRFRQRRFAETHGVDHLAGPIGSDPEPLPDDHPLWSRHNVLVTPHVGNTEEMGVPLLAAHIERNVARFGRGEPLEGIVDPEAGY